jgi:CubicO group peptidase (beta-lactamase class C family)
VHLGEYHYENLNYGLCRILLATINGNLPPSFPGDDQLWDLLTITAYLQYAEARVLGPAGATGATLDHPPDSALAYYWPDPLDGWNSGNLAAVCGGAGWHMSIDELLDVMGTFRRKGTILSQKAAQTMLDSEFGVDLFEDTPAGRLYNKNGRWTLNKAQTEQALAYFLPEDMELAVYANSQIAQPPKFFRDVVTNIYLGHLA